MSIRERIEDAHFLLDSGRAGGALLCACAAISATSRKRYGREEFNDRKAFTKFLGEEVAILTCGSIKNINIYVGSMTPEYKKYYKDDLVPIQEIMYDFVRCHLAHECTISEHIAFCDSDNFDIKFEKDQLALNALYIKRLCMVSEFAPENWEDFPEIAAKSDSDVCEILFGDRMENYAEYIRARRERLVASIARGDSFAS